MSRVSVLDVISSSSRKASGDFSSMDRVFRKVRRTTAPVCQVERTSLGERASTSGIYKVMQLVPLERLHIDSRAPMNRTERVVKGSQRTRRVKTPTAWQK